MWKYFLQEIPVFSRVHTFFADKLKISHSSNCIKRQSPTIKLEICLLYSR